MAGDRFTKRGKKSGPAALRTRRPFRRGRPRFPYPSARRRIDDDRTHVREVDNQTVVAERPARNVVAAAANGNSDVVSSGEADRLHHISGAADAHD